MMFGKRISPPLVARNPTFTSESPNLAFSDATIMSHASAISRPPATAVPFAAQMIGFAERRSVIPANPCAIIV